MNEIINPLSDFKSFMPNRKKWIRIILFTIKIHIPIALGALGITAVGCNEQKTVQIGIPVSNTVVSPDITKGWSVDPLPTDTVCCTVIYPECETNEL